MNVAKASARSSIILTLIEACRSPGFGPFKYLHYMLSCKPTIVVKIIPLSANLRQ